MKKGKSQRKHLSRRDFSKLMSAAVAGMMGAGALAGCSGQGKKGPEAEPGEKHACKGLNSCKGKGGCKTANNDCAGKNDCKGKGGCATVAHHDCAGKNECKSLGCCLEGNTPSKTSRRSSSSGR